MCLEYFPTVSCLIFYHISFTGSRVANAEIGAIVDEVGNTNANGYKHDIVVQHVGGPTITLPSNHRLVDPLTYPLLFPRGDNGWGLGCVPLIRSKGKQTHVSAHQYLKYRCQHRKDGHDYHMLHGRLTQEWIINNFLKIESDRLDYLQSEAGQKKLRADKYKEVKKAKRLNRFVIIVMSILICCNVMIPLMFVIRLGQSGRHIVLPSSYRGSPRDNVQRYGDSMAIVRSLGKPHMFLTMTTNPKWKEIVSALPPGREPHHCPWIGVRVFKQKFDLLLDDVLKNDVLGKVSA